jgi:hypothetical protein
LEETENAMNGIRCYELLEDLAPCGSARAVLLRWNNGQYIRTSEQIIVNEFVNTHGDRGDRGYAFQSTESGRWEALSGLFQQVPNRGLI